MACIKLGTDVNCMQKAKMSLATLLIETNISKGLMDA